MKGVVLAGGTGTRLHPLTRVINKHLLPVYDEPMIFKPIKTLRDSGVRDIVIVLGGLSTAEMVTLLGDGSGLGVSLSYVHQEHPRGIADALHAAKGHVAGGKIAVILGDNIFADAFPGEFKAFEHDGKHGSCLFLKEVDDPGQFGIVQLDGNGTITGIEEKPVHPASNIAATGLYLYDETVFDRVEAVLEATSVHGDVLAEITPVNASYIREGKACHVRVKGFWVDAGTKRNLLGAALHFAHLPTGAMDATGRAKLER